MLPACVAVLDSLLPVFLIVGLGAMLTRFRWLEPALARELNRIAYWIGMPGLLFASVCRIENVSDRPLEIFLVLLAATLAIAALAFGCARWLKMPAASVGTFMQAAFRGNLAFLALPVTVYAFSGADSPESASSVAPVVALAIAPLMIIYNLLAAVVLIVSQHGVRRQTLAPLTRQLLLNPLVLATAAGLGVSTLRMPVPDFLFESIRTVGGLAIPAALLGVGCTMATNRVGTQLRPALVGALLKVVAAPLIGIALARAAGFSPVDMKIVGILLAAPTAAASFIMAQQLKGDAALASSMVVLTTLCSAVSLGMVLSVL
jgi:malate permease and related proteins